MSLQPITPQPSSSPHYVSNEAKRVQALEALTYYQRSIGGEDQLDQLTDDDVATEESDGER